MATITCTGGHSFLDGQIPSPYAWTLISDVKFERAFDDIGEQAKAGEDFELVAELILRSHGYPAYICPQCDRLIVFENGLENPAASYRRE